MATKVAIEVDVKTGEANDDIIALREELEKVKSTQKKLSDEMKAGFQSAEKGAKNASKGMKGFGQSIGSVIKSLGIMALALQVLAKIGELLQSNQRIADGLSKAMVTLEVVFGNVASAVQDLVDGLQDIKNLSFDDIIQKFRNFGNALLNGADGALETAENIVKMRNELQLAEAQQRKFMLEMQNQAEIQRQIRDNTELDIETRMRANDEIARILAEQTEGELRIADLRISLREAELAMNKESIPAQAALIDAQAERADVEERINGILSEQKTNATALREEEKQLIDQRNEASIAAEQFTVEGLYPWYSQFIQQQHALDDEFKTNRIALEEFLRQTNENITDDEIAHHDRMLRLTQSYEAQRSQIVAAEAEARRQAQIGAATETANAIGAIGQLVTQMAGENAAAAKALAIAELGINTAVAISNAIATASKASNVYEMIGGIAAGVAAVVSSIAQAEQILNATQVPGGGSAPSVSFSAPSAPALQPVTTSTTELGGAEQAQLAPIQAYVVETEVTGNQNNISQIESQATFPG
jgi:hypothetical protein